MIALPLILAGAAVAQEKPANLLPDPAFADVNLDPLAEKTSWIWHQIVLPSEASADKQAKSMTLSGGKTFLHSGTFDVKPGASYAITLRAAGTGKVSVECLWWKRYEQAAIEMTEPHRTIPRTPVEVTADGIKVDVRDTAPEGAAKAYIRIVVEEGEVTLSEPNVTPAPAE
jgi:hypothetical protein